MAEVHLSQNKAGTPPRGRGSDQHLARRQPPAFFSCLPPSVWKGRRGGFKSCCVPLHRIAPAPVLLPPDLFGGCPCSSGTRRGPRRPTTVPSTRSRGPRSSPNPTRRRLIISARIEIPTNYLRSHFFIPPQFLRFKHPFQVCRCVSRRPRISQVRFYA